MAQSNHLREEMTFLMIKPDGVRRGLIGEIIGRIERVGLKIVAIKMTKADEAHVDAFYPRDEEWIKRIGGKTLSTYEKLGLDAQKELGTADPLAIGNMVRSWLIIYMTSAPVVPLVVKGIHAVSMIRKLVGETMPANAQLGSIRGDFSTDSPAAANMERRSVFNIVHATETEEEAAKELRHWFTPEEICDYRRTDDEVFD